MLPGSSLNGSPRLASLEAAVTRFFSLSASRLARALARSSALELDMCVGPEAELPAVITRLVRPCARARVIQYSRDASARASTARRTECPACAGHDAGIEPQACRGRNFERHEPEE